MKRKFMIYFFCSILLYSCTEKRKDAINSISVDLEQKQDVSFFDLFSKIDIIPLETNDLSLIKFVQKVIVNQGNIYVQDLMSKILVFSPEGKFLFKIDKKGMGPDEYLDISDFDILNDSLSVLSAIENRMLIYNNNGHFVRKFSLPRINGAYNSFKNINNDTIAFWTYDYEKRIKIYSKSAKSIFKEGIPEKDNIYRNMGMPLFPYGTFIPSVTDNRVFKITPKSEIVEAYKWDFGKLNNTPEMTENAPKLKTQNEMMEFIKKIQSSEVINYDFISAGGNSRYIYTKLGRKNTHINIFYDKLSKKTYQFEKTTEKIKFYPLYWTESYMIGFIPEKVSTFNDIIPDVILNQEQIKIKNNLSKFDNPVLVKYYFKT